MNQPKKVVVFLSGRGTNFKTIINHQKSFKDNSAPFLISRAICNKPGAPGLFYAKENNIPVTELFRADFENIVAFKDALFNVAKDESSDLIVLAGFMLLVPDWFIDEFYGKVINIHPSLLPDYPGLDTHERVLKDKKNEHGCTVHFVDKGLDTGPVIAQAKLNVVPNESASELAARVLVLEHKIYPWVVEMLTRGEITLKGENCFYSEKAIESAKQEGYLLNLG
jgi:phosphoribosylglycinamide formyltransferase-1